jgi:hypothetical protein
MLIVMIENPISMKINFNRRRIETISIFLSFLFVMLLTVFGILAIADEIFSWDILSDHLEKIAILFMSATGMIIGATFLISMMVNFSLISISIERIAEHFAQKNKEHE